MPVVVAVDPLFLPLIRDRLEELEASANTIIGTWPDGRIGYFNPAYVAFARTNGAPADFGQRWGLGAMLLTSIPEVLRGPYDEGMRRVVATLERWDAVYQCPTPELHQEFTLRMYALAGGAGVLHVHALRMASPHQLVGEGDRDVLTRPDGFIRQCANCRHVQRADDQQWLFVASLVQDPPANLSHGICPDCLTTYNPGRPRAS